MSIMDVDTTLNLADLDNFTQVLYSFIINLAHDEDGGIGQWYDNYRELFKYIKMYGYTKKYKDGIETSYNEIYMKLLELAKEEYPNNPVNMRLDYFPTNLVNFVSTNYNRPAVQWWMHVFH